MPPLAATVRYFFLVELENKAIAPITKAPNKTLPRIPPPDPPPPQTPHVPPPPLQCRQELQVVHAPQFEDPVHLPQIALF